MWIKYTKEYDMYPVQEVYLVFQTDFYDYRDKQLDSIRLLKIKEFIFKHFINLIRKNRIKRLEYKSIIENPNGSFRIYFNNNIVVYCNKNGKPLDVRLDKP